MVTRILKIPTTGAFLPTIALLGSILSLSVGTSFAKTLFPIIGAASTTFLRVSLAAILLLLIHRPWQYAWDRRRLLTVCCYGLLLGAMNLLFYQALRTIPFGIAVAIEFIGPLTLALLSSRRAIELVWVALAVGGLTLLLPIHTGLPTPQLSPVGIAFALGAAACWFLYIVVGQRASGAHGGQAVAVGLLVGGCVTAPFGAVQALPVLHDGHLAALAVGVALLSSAIPYSLEMYSLRHLPKQTFGILLSLEPAFAALAAFVILGEALSGLQCLAVVSIIGASVGATITGNRRRMKSGLSPTPVASPSHAPLPSPSPIATPATTDSP
jgi:inner membrane transporter RhtA